MTTVPNKTFTLSETKDKKQLLFYRNDGEILNLNGLEREVCNLFESYVVCKMITGKILNFSFEFVSEVSDDNKCILLTFSDGNVKQPNIFKRLIKKIFG